MHGLANDSEPEYHYNIYDYPSATWRQPSPPSSPFFLLPEANVPRQVPLSGEYSGYDALHDEATYPRTGASHEGAYSQVPPALPRPDPWSGASVGQPAMGGSHLPAFDSQYPDQPANALYPPYTFDPTYQQYPGHMLAGGFQYKGPPIVQDPLGGPPYYEPWTSSQPVLSWPPSSSTDLYRSPQSPVPPQGFGVDNEHYLPSPIIDSESQPPSPRRDALIIGINYTSHSNPDSRLNHGVEDAYAMANFLCKDWGFAHKNVRIMTDASSQRDDLPTKDNILNAMKELVHGAKSQDSFFVYFSGHGQQIKDLNGDEHDGFDGCLCAMDFCGDDKNPTPGTPGLIVDDLMHEILVKPLPSGCRLTAIFDACHSGTLLDLPYVYNSSGVVKRSILPHKIRFSGMLKRTKSSCADVISLGSSKDRQESRETKKGGALRRAFIDCMRASKNNITYKELIPNLRKAVKQYQQQPQLSSSHEIDTGDKFII